MRVTMLFNGPVPCLERNISQRHLETILDCYYVRSGCAGVSYILILSGREFLYFSP
jgi:hypothetical protein